MAKPAIILALVIAGHLAGPWLSFDAVVLSPWWTALIFALTAALIVNVIVLWRTRPGRDEECCHEAD